MNKSYYQNDPTHFNFIKELRGRQNIRLLETVLMAYITVCTLWYALYKIVPFSTAVNGTVLINFPVWLRITGVLLIVAEVIMVPPRKRAPLRFLLYGICLSALISSFIYIRYGFLKNFQSILTMFEVFVLFYGAPFAIPRKRLKSFAAVLHTLLAIVWFVACCLSFAQFLLRVGSHGPNLPTTIWLRGVGFYKDRLTGVFGFAEYGGITGLILMVAGLYRFLKSDSRLTRVIIVILNVPVYLYIVLSASRNTALAFFEAIFVGTFLLCRKYFRKTAEKSIMFSFMLALLVLFVSIPLYTGTRTCALFIRGLIPYEEEEASEETAHNGNAQTLEEARMAPGLPAVIPAGSSAKGVMSAMHLPGSEKNPAVALSYTKGGGPAAVADNSSAEGPAVALSYTKGGGPAAVADNSSAEDSESSKSSKSSKEKTTKKEFGVETEGSSLFGRTYRDGDLSTGRLKIWRNYFRLAKEIGIFGLSPENTGYYVQEHHPKMYIVTSPEINVPEAAKNGYVFHPHNGYIKVYASAGFLGTFLMLGFFICAIVRFIRWIFSHRTLSLEFITLAMILLVCASAAMFDMELFFVYTPPTFLFWLCMSFMFKATTHSGAHSKPR